MHLHGRAVLAGGFAALIGVGFAVQAQEDSPAASLAEEDVLPMESVRLARFRFLDLDGDGYLSRNEVPAADEVLRSQFSTLDRDGDGRLSAGEYGLYGGS